MNQPSVYSYSQIIDAAFDLIREKGWMGITTRAIANKIGCSTMPIYSHVNSVDELEKALRQKARELLKEFQQHRYTEHVLLNLAFGYVVFARDEKNLFRFLYLEKPDQVDLEDVAEMKEKISKEFRENRDEVKAFEELNNSGQEALIQYTWIFTHGLAMLVNSGVLKAYSDEKILGFLMGAGEAFYLWGIQREGREDEKGYDKK